MSDRSIVIICGMALATISSIAWAITVSSLYAPPHVPMTLAETCVYDSYRYTPVCLSYAARVGKEP